MRTLISGLTAAVVLTCATAAARADLSFANLTFNVGEVRSGAALKRTFTFVNDGPAAVEITGLRSSCGCVRPRLDKRTYLPGERGEVTLEVQTLSQPAGPSAWPLRLVYRSGGEERETELSIKGSVIAEITVQPASLAISTERASSLTLTLTDHRTRPLTVTAVQSSSPYLTGTVKQTTTDEAGHRVVTMALSVSAEFAEGRHDEMVAIITDDADYRVLTVPAIIVKRSKHNVERSAGGGEPDCCRGSAGGLADCATAPGRRRGRRRRAG